MGRTSCPSPSSHTHRPPHTPHTALTAIPSPHTPGASQHQPGAVRGDTLRSGKGHGRNPHASLLRHQLRWLLPQVLQKGNYVGRPAVFLLALVCISYIKIKSRRPDTSVEYSSEQLPRKLSSFSDEV